MSEATYARSQRRRRGRLPHRPHLPLLVLLLLALAHSLPASAAAKPERRKLEPRSGPTPRSIQERGLAGPHVSAADLAEGGREFDAAVARRRFRGSVLAYVTPWHRGGYEAAVRFRGKLTHVSPVWYQLRVDDQKQLALVGGHEFNATWLAELRAPLPDGSSGGGSSGCSSDGEGGSQTCSADGSSTAGVDEIAAKPPPLIVPRVVVELGGQELGLLLTRPGPAIERLVEEVSKRGYDGLVLECWQQWVGLGVFHSENAEDLALGFIRQLGANLVDAGKFLVLAVPPALPASPGRPHADVEKLAGLASMVQGFSVMTYDYLSPVPGPNGPLPWQLKNIKLLTQGTADGGSSSSSSSSKKKGKVVPAGSVFLGLNFYGYEFSRPEDGQQWSPEPVLADRFLSVLGRFQPAMVWDEETREHHVKFKDGGKRRQLFFPTPASIAERVALAGESGVGIAIWEIGQGMNCFFDLL